MNVQKKTNDIQIGSRHIGMGLPCFLVAEVGLNHNGDLELAKKTIDAAAAAGADSVKFQNYVTEDFILDRSLTYEYISQGQTVVESQYDMFKRCELSQDDLLLLKNYCDEKSVIFHSTPTGPEGIQALVDIGTPLMKNGSDYLTHLPVIRAMGNTNLPTVLSTGMATLNEVDEAVRTFRDTGNDQLILLHCTSSYPTPPEDVHLRKIPALAAAFDCPVGLSDHTAGIAAALGAVTLGACWIEKHFTLDRNLPGPDHRFSSNPEEFHELSTAVRTLEKCLGTSVITPTPSEALGRRAFRLSCVYAKAFSSGHVLSASDLVFKRPGEGVPPAHAYLLTGRTLNRDVEAGKLVQLEDLQ